MNATEVCRLLGGGGHARAAGATLEGVSRAEAEEKNADRHCADRAGFQEDEERAMPAAL